MAHQPLKLGFIGGNIHSAIGTTHFSASRLDGLWSLEAGAFSRNDETNRKTGEAWHIPLERTYSDWKKFVDREAQNLDAICILTDSPSHREMIEYVAKTKTPIICEKPIVTSLEEVNSARALLTPQNFFATIFNYTGYPMVRELKQIIADGDLGKIHQIHVEMPQEGFIRDKSSPQSWRLKDGTIPTICLDLGTHLFHLISFLTEESPNEVMAEYAHFSKHREIVDYATFWMRFASGMKGSAWLTKTATGDRNGLKVRLYGEKGSATWLQISPEELHLNFTDGRKITKDRGSHCSIASAPRYNRMRVGHPAGFLEAFANLYADIAEALPEFESKGKWSSPYVFGFEEASRGIAVLEAASMSAKSGSWTRLP